MTHTIPLIYKGTRYEVEYEVEEARDFRDISICDVSGSGGANPNDIPDALIMELPDLIAQAIDADDAELIVDDPDQ